MSTQGPARRLISELYPHAQPYIGGYQSRFGPDDLGRVELKIASEDRIWVRHLVIENAEDRGRGYGGRELARLSEAADRYGVDIGLEAFWRPDLADGGPLQRLYRRAGFDPVGEPDDQGMQELIRGHAPSDPFRNLLDPGVSAMPEDHEMGMCRA